MSANERRGAAALQYCTHNRRIEANLSANSYKHPCEKKAHKYSNPPHRKAEKVKRRMEGKGSKGEEKE